MNARLAALLPALALTACTTVGPDFQPPSVAAPGRWDHWHGGDPSLAHTAEPAPELLRWGQLADPALQALMRRAEQGNPDVLTAALHLVQARVHRAQVEAHGAPQLASALEAARQRQSEHGSATRIANALPAGTRPGMVDALSAPHSLYQAGFDAAWELDLWGRVRRALEGADARVESSGAMLGYARLAVRAEVAREYAALRTIQRQRRLLQAQVGVAEDVLHLQQVRIAAGLEDHGATAKQRGMLAQLRAREPVLLQEEAAAVNRLTLLLGEVPGALQRELNDAPGDTSWAVRLPVQPGLPSTLALRRPDIQAALASLHAATAAIGLAVADLYPRITLTGSLGLEALSTSDLASWGARQWRIGPSLSLPLFDGSRRRATVTLRELEQQEAAVRFQRTVLQAWHEVDGALSAYNAAKRQHGDARARVEAAGEALELAQHRFRGGLSDELSVLQARQALAQAEMAESEVLGSAATAWIALAKALAVQD